MSKVYSGGIKIATGFKSLSNEPIADYMVVEFIDDLDLLPNQFEGMTTYAKEDGNLWVKDANGWRILGEGAPSEGADKHFTFAQLTPSDYWICQHNLDKKVSVTVVDGENKVVEGEVIIINNNRVELHFNVPFWGYAYFN